MGFEIILRIAAIGILVSVVNQILSRSGRDEYATMSTLAGITIVLLMVVKEIANLFDTVTTMFQFLR